MFKRLTESMLSRLGGLVLLAALLRSPLHPLSGVPRTSHLDRCMGLRIPCCTMTNNAARCECICAASTTGTNAKLRATVLHPRYFFLLLTATTLSCTEPMTSVA